MYTICAMLGQENISHLNDRVFKKLTSCFYDGNREATVEKIHQLFLLWLEISSQVTLMDIS